MPMKRKGWNKYIRRVRSKKKKKKKKRANECSVIIII